MKHSIAFLCGISLFLLSSCKIMFPNRMFKQGDYEYFQVSEDIINQYLIHPGDLITLEIYSRDGFDLVDVLSLKEGGNTFRQGQYKQVYLVDQEGYVTFPVFGKIQTTGYTEEELRMVIEEKSAALFVEPFVILKVANRRAFVFRGSEASVVTLNEGPTTLIEVLAKAGGLSRNLKAYNIKIIRGNLSEPEIIQIDLSTINGLKNADIIVQANDVVYVEERLRVTQGILGELSPVLSLLTSFAAIIVLVTNK